MSCSIYVVTKNNSISHDEIPQAMCLSVLDQVVQEKIYDSQYGLRENRFSHALLNNFVSFTRDYQKL